MIRHIGAFAVVTLSTVLLAGCSGQSQPSAHNDWVDQSTGPAVQPVMLEFGKTHTWPTGDQITISSPERVDGNLEVTVAYRNGTQGVETSYGIDSVFMVNAYTDDHQLMPVFSRSQTATPPNYLPPGRSITYRQAFELPTGAHQKVQIQASGVLNDPQRPVVFYEGTI